MDYKETIERLLIEIDSLKRTNEKLLKRVSELERKLEKYENPKNSNNSSIPPSQDPNRDKKFTEKVGERHL